MLLFERSNITRPVHSFRHPRSKIPKRKVRLYNMWRIVKIRMLFHAFQRRHKSHKINYILVC